MAEITMTKARPERSSPRVCAYVRVSTSGREQLNSFEEQLRYWNERLGNDSSVNYVGMYSDEGISGSSTAKRKGFQQVMNLALNKEIDIVYTKSLSRFSRNMVESLDSIEILRKCDVKVVFDKEGIDTFDTGARFTLNLLSRIAEEDLNSISQNIIMSTRSKIASGKVLVPKVYGYISTYNKKTREYDLVINSEQADVVRLIFSLYIKGYGRARIAEQLDIRNYPTPRGTGSWSQSTVRSILLNEKYKGDTIMQKKYLSNGKMVRNDNYNPDAPIVMISNTHEGIVTREIFDNAMAIKKERLVNEEQYEKAKRYAFRGKIECGDCGLGFRHKIAYYKGMPKYEFWDCYNRQDRGYKKMCNNHAVKDSILYGLFEECYKECINANIDCCDIETLTNRNEQLRQSEKDLNGLKAKKYITDEMYHNELSTIITERKEIQSLIDSEKRKHKQVFELQKDETNDDAIINYLDKVIVNDWTVTFVFINGYETSRRYNNDNTKNSDSNTI